MMSAMRACFFSSSPTPSPHSHRPPPHPNIFSLSSRSTLRIRPRLVRVLKESVEAEISPPSKNSEGLGGAGGLEAVQTDSKDNVPVPDSGKTKKRKEEEEEGPDSSSSRFKLRNGREVFEEKAYLVGVECKGSGGSPFGTEESLKELEQLADTAGLAVVGSTYQKLASPNPRTYIGSGKAAEIKSAIHALDVETVIFDDELSAGSNARFVG